MSVKFGSGSRISTDNITLSDEDTIALKAMADKDEDLQTTKGRYTAMLKTVLDKQDTAIGEQMKTQAYIAKKFSYLSVGVVILALLLGGIYGMNFAAIQAAKETHVGGSRLETLEGDVVKTASYTPHTQADAQALSMTKADAALLASHYESGNGGTMTVGFVSGSSTMMMTVAIISMIRNGGTLEMQIVVAGSGNQLLVSCDAADQCSVGSNHALAQRKKRRLATKSRLNDKKTPSQGLVLASKRKEQGSTQLRARLEEKTTGQARKNQMMAGQVDRVAGHRALNRRLENENVFVLGNIGENTCGAIGVQLSNDREHMCRIAADELGYTFSGAGTWDSDPRGCMWQLDGNSMWFNRHDIGSESGGYGPVCNTATTPWTATGSKADISSCTASYTQDTRYVCEHSYNGILYSGNDGWVSERWNSGSWVKFDFSAAAWVSKITILTGVGYVMTWAEYHVLSFDIFLQDSQGNDYIPPGLAIANANGPHFVSGARVDVATGQSHLSLTCTPTADVYGVKLVVYYSDSGKTILLNELIVEGPSETAGLSSPSLEQAPANPPVGILVAGDIGESSADGGFNNPRGMFVTDEGTLYVADYYNHRVMKWEEGAQTGTQVAGWGEGPWQRSDLQGLNGPVGVSVVNGAVFVSEDKNHRVTKWPAGATVGIAVAGSTRWSPQVSPTWYVNQGCGDDKLSVPRALHVTEDETVYVVDAYNLRVMKWLSGATSGTRVAGRENCWDSEDADKLNVLIYPEGMSVAADGTVYATDQMNRVTKWQEGERRGTVVAGENMVSGYDTDHLYNPFDVHVSGSGAIYVADYGNFCVKKWGPGAFRSIVVAGEHSQYGGQSDLNRVCNVKGVFVAPDGSLYVSDTCYHRVVKYPSTEPEIIQITSCTPSNANVISDACKCSLDSATNECLEGQFCWTDYTCNDVALTDCPPSNTNVISDACKCSTDSTTNECLEGQFCWMDNTCKDMALIDCTPSNANVLEAACKCSTDSTLNECWAGEYCWMDNTCNDEALIDCTPSNANVLEAACKCSTDSATNECSAGQFCWTDNTCDDVGRCEVLAVEDGDAKPCAEQDGSFIKAGVACTLQCVEGYVPVEDEPYNTVDCTTNGLAELKCETEAAHDLRAVLSMGDNAQIEAIEDQTVTLEATITEQAEQLEGLLLTGWDGGTVHGAVAGGRQLGFFSASSWRLRLPMNIVQHQLRKFLNAQVRETYMTIQIPGGWGTRRLSSHEPAAGTVSVKLGSQILMPIMDSDGSDRRAQDLIGGLSSEVLTVTGSAVEGTWSFSLACDSGSEDCTITVFNEKHYYYEYTYCGEAATRDPDCNPADEKDAKRRRMQAENGVGEPDMLKDRAEGRRLGRGIRNYRSEGCRLDMTLSEKNKRCR